jgi:hypothetical protein
MNEIGSSPDPGQDAGSDLVVAGQYRDRAAIARRQRIVGYLRYVRNFPFEKIRSELAKMVPPIIVDRSTLSRDCQDVRSKYRQQFNAKDFDAVAEVGIVVGQYDVICRNALSDAIATKDYRERALLYRVYLRALEQKMDLLQDVGLIDRRVGTLTIDSEGTASTRVPSGEQLQKLFDSVNVVEGELVSEAERAWLYGDAAAAESAAKEADRAG